MCAWACRRSRPTSRRSEGTAEGRIIEDEGAYGTCHVALGSNVHFGGTLRAPLHLDMVMWEPRLVVDGRVLMDQGRLVEEGS